VTYQYNAVVVRVVDGDTFVGHVDLGFGVWLHDQNFRLLGINAREKKDPGGPEARENLAGLLPAGLAITLTTVKADKYGSRYDAHVLLPGNAILSQMLVQTGWAAAWSGAGTKPVPPWPRTAS
jgi:endonuclease YncB( thermonuclease family)